MRLNRKCFKFCVANNASRIYIHLYPGHIDIENPGGLYRDLTVKMLGKRSVCRNPLIANFFSISDDTAVRELNVLVDKNLIHKQGQGKAVFYVLDPFFEIENGDGSGYSGGHASGAGNGAGTGRG